MLNKIKQWVKGVPSLWKAAIFIDRNLVDPIRIKRRLFKKQVLPGGNGWIRAKREVFDTMKEFKSCYEAHRDEFKQVARLLEDGRSRRTLRAVIRYRLSSRGAVFLPIIDALQYFPKGIIKMQKDEVFVDGGGYTGDTIFSMARRWGKNCWKKIYTWEPDAQNRKRLIGNCKEQGFENIEVIPMACWNERTELHFNMKGEDCSRVTEDGSCIVQADAIDHICSKEKITYIKMDLEGCELQALQGAEEIIRRDKPRLAISIYHKPVDYFEIPFYVKRLVPEYKLYIRHHKFSMNDTVLYAVYDEKSARC